MKNLMEDPDYQLVIVDAMNLCARMYNTPGLNKLSHEGHPTGMLYGVMRKVFELKKAYPKAKIWFLWEGGVNKRKALHAHYKQSRDRKEDDFRGCVDEVRKLLPSIGVVSMFHFGLEADDMAAHISATTDPEVQILMISNDEDWLQYVRKNVDLQRNSSGGAENENDLADSLGFHPSKMGMWKILRGDASDDIKGVHRIPAAVIRLLLNRCDSWEQFREYPLAKHNPAWDRWEYTIKEDWDKLKTNAELILYHPEWIEESQIVVEEAKIDYDVLRTVFTKYNMKSLLKELE